MEKTSATSTIENLKITDLVQFKKHIGQTYEGDRLQQMMDSIEKYGLQSPIIVRPTDDGKYEIVCGHNRVKAFTELGRDEILADVRAGLSDDEAEGLYFDSNLNQQSFADWKYSQKIEAVKYLDKLIKENSEQGKRSDLKTDEKTKEPTSVHTRHKLDKDSKRSTIRDKMARRMGIATATLSKYRSILKLSDDIIQMMARMLDEKKLSFEAAYRISQIDSQAIELLLKMLDKSSDMKPDIDKLKLRAKESKDADTILPVSQSVIKALLMKKAEK